jgi:hypothetical protein
MPAPADPNLLAGGGPLEVVAEVVAELVAADVHGCGSGAGGIRTHDLPAASRTLVPLSYSPGELEVRG